MINNNLKSYLNKFDSQFSDLKYIDNNWYKEKVGVFSFIKKATSKDSKERFSEEYLRARFVWSLVYSGMFNKEYICVEFGFPKGNTKTKLKPDIVVFKNKDWLKDFILPERSKNFYKIIKNMLGNF